MTTWPPSTSSLIGMENGAVVEPHGLTKRYGSGVLAVDSVDMSVRRGEVYGFLGPNGAGKTTTLRMLVGLIRPTAGTASVAGHSPGSPAGLGRIGSLIESPGFYPYLSGRENLRAVAGFASASQKPAPAGPHTTPPTPPPRPKSPT